MKTRTLALIAACTTPPFRPTPVQHTEPPPARAIFTPVLTMERTACYGSCPTFVLELAVQTEADIKAAVDAALAVK